MVTGCASNSFSGKVRQVSDSDDTYEFTLSRNSYTTLEYNDNQFKKGVQSIMEEHGYKDYKLLKVEHNSLAAKDTYNVKFYK